LVSDERPGYDRHLLRYKVDWEGGILDTLEYAITAENINDPELAAAWGELAAAYNALTPLLARVDKLLRTPESGSETREP
jgi:hypothetical protein